jgi:hypothetical protein
MMLANPYHAGASPRTDLAALVAAVRATQNEATPYQHDEYGGPRSTVGGVMKPTQLVCRGASA